MEILEKMEYITLNNGVKMPMAGLGTFLLSPACYDFAEAYNAQGGNCTVVDLPKEGITGNDHFMFQDLNNDVIADHIENWIQENVN
ncbi:hypothetical protein [Simiaoa sunii]|jgi:hypothetical protein|uniref:hypothetical protein n=1 Tax=Simiaoa sunii TaxID=2763672 RepID=UPI000967752B|nr:MAG: hypothetical protein BHW40_12495 [Firmicutes bacterium CAG:65_45_313]